MKKRIILACAAAAMVQQANAEIIIFLQEVGSDVTATVSGDMNLAALGGYFGDFNAYNGYLPSNGAVASSGSVNTYTVPNNWTPYGTGGFGNWDSHVGDSFALWTDPALGLPLGYATGDPISATMTKFNSSFASLGIDEGTFVSTISNGGVTDYVTVTTVPVPGTLALMGLGFAGLRRRR